MSGVISQTELEEIAENNYIKALNSDWLDQNAPRLFAKYPGDVEFIVITEIPPQNIYTFDSKGKLLEFIAGHPRAAFRYRGFEKDNFML